MVYATDVENTARFWERLGFTRYVELKPDGNPVALANRARVTPG